jgi:hypothetical protein
MVSTGTNTINAIKTNSEAVLNNVHKKKNPKKSPFAIKPQDILWLWDQHVSKIMESENRGLSLSHMIS